MPAPPVAVAAGLGYGLHEGGGKRLRSSGTRTHWITSVITSSKRLSDNG